MSRPVFLFDHDVNEDVVKGIGRREPAIELSRARDHGIHELPDDEVLDFAGTQGWVLVSHDVNTMSAAAYRRIAAGGRMSGLVLAPQNIEVRKAIEDLLLIWVATEAEEWADQVAYLPIK